MAKSILYRTNDPKSKERKDDYFAYLDDRHKGKQVEHLISIKKNNPVRSTSANSYYWIILQAIANFTGNTKDEEHAYFKKKFNGKEIRGEWVGQSTTELDSAEFTVYLKKVKEFAKTIIGVTYIPEPEDRAYNVWAEETKNNYNSMFQAI